LVHAVAITRGVSSSINQCELTHLPRDPIDVERARSQHRAYEACLLSLGCELRRLPVDERYPDAVFVEDTAIVLDEIAIRTRPGAVSRRGEVSAVAEILSEYRTIVRLCEPATLDGGDVLLLHRTLYIGRTPRTSDAGIAQVRELVEPYGYRVVGVPVNGCLHLKSAVTGVGEDVLLMNRRWVPPEIFGDGWRILDVDESEPSAANALRVGDSVIFPEELSRTRKRLEEAGIDVRPVPSSELARAEGGVTCCSVIVRL